MKATYKYDGRNSWIKEQEVVFHKKWLELQAKFHWDNFRINEEVSNNNTDLWKKLRNEK